MKKWLLQYIDPDGQTHRAEVRCKVPNGSDDVYRLFREAFKNTRNPLPSRNLVGFAADLRKYTHIKRQLTWVHAPSQQHIYLQIGNP